MASQSCLRGSTLSLRSILFPFQSFPILPGMWSTPPAGRSLDAKRLMAFSPHCRMQRAVPTDVAWFVCMCVRHDREPLKNGRTDRNAVWKHVFDGTTIEWFVCGGDAGFCQITLTSLVMFPHL